MSNHFLMIVDVYIPDVSQLSGVDCIYIYIYINRTKVFQHLILSHINNTKMGLIMKRVNSKWYGLQLIGFHI